jgi:hypothetical protein
MTWILWRGVLWTSANGHLDISQSASPSQRAILDANYGRKDSDSEGRCKAIFEELDLRTRYAAYEEDAVGRINALIDKVPERNYGEGVSRAFLFSPCRLSLSSLLGRNDWTLTVHVAGHVEAGYFP